VAQQVALGHDEADIPLEAPPSCRAAEGHTRQTTRGTTRPPRPRGSRQASTKAIGKLNALLTDLGYTDRDKALAHCSEVVGAPVASRNDLTGAQVSKTGHLGPKCRHGCGQRVPLERVADHEGTNHAGDEL
jgi:hypothetical protein